MKPAYKASQASTVPALSTQKLCVTLGDRPVLHDVDLQIAPKRWTAIVGPNGAGKSTLLRALADMRASHQAQSGQVLLQGKPLKDWPGRQRARTLSWLGQNQSVAAEMAVYDLVMLGRLPHQGWLAAPDAADKAAVEQALRQTHAWDWRQRGVGELSGGERQRVLLARAQVAVGTTVVSVLHELSFALLADELVVMKAGRIVHHGACIDPATHAVLEAVFDQRIQVRELDGMYLATPRIV